MVTRGSRADPQIVFCTKKHRQNINILPVQYLNDYNVDQLDGGMLRSKFSRLVTFDSLNLSVKLK